MEISKFLRKRRGREKFENLLGMGDVLRDAKFETGFIKRFFLQWNDRRDIIFCFLLLISSCLKLDISENKNKIQ